MKVINKLQYIFLFILSFIIVGATAIITGDVGFDCFKDTSFYINQLLTNAAILCVTFATLYAYLDNFKTTNKEYIDNITYIERFATGKNNIPSILNLFLDSLNHTRKINQFKYNIKKELYLLENKRKFKFVGKKVYTENDYYVWNHGTESEKAANEYCSKRKFLEDQLTDEYINKNIDIKYVKYDKVTSSVILGGFYKHFDSAKANEFVTKNPDAKIAQHKIPQIFGSFAIMFVLSSLVFGAFDFSITALINMFIKLLALVWNSYTALRYARTFSQSVTLKDTRFRKGIILEYEKWLNQEAAKVMEQDRIKTAQREAEEHLKKDLTKQELDKQPTLDSPKQEVEEVTTNDSRGNTTISIEQLEV